MVCGVKVLEEKWGPGVLDYSPMKRNKVVPLLDLAYLWLDLRRKMGFRGAWN